MLALMRCPTISERERERLGIKFMTNNEQVMILKDTHDQHNGVASICICQLQIGFSVFNCGVNYKFANKKNLEMFSHTTQTPWAIMLSHLRRWLDDQQKLRATISFCLVKFKFSFDYLPILKSLNCTIS